MGRLGIADNRWEIVVAAVVLGLILGPQLFQRFHRFPCLGPPVVEVTTHHGGLFAVPAGADSENEPSLAVQIEDRDLFGQDQRIAFRDQGDSGRQLDFAGDGGGHGQGDIRLREVTVSPRDLAAG